MPPNTDLYVTDFYTWCLEQAARSRTCWLRLMFRDRFQAV
jgi:hypothetical protein